MPSKDLSDLTLKTSYATMRDNLITSFYSPCLHHSVLYRRAVGFFTSRGLALAAQGVAHLIRNDGNMRLIASPLLEEEDENAINQGYEDRPALLQRIVVRSFQEVYDQLTSDRLNALAWLIASGRLDIRLALKMNSNGTLSRGIFHEKTGIFSDVNGNKVAFSGSSNETVGGLVQNFEVIDVFWSWDDPQGRVQEKSKHFDSLWNGNTTGLEIVDFTEASRDFLGAYRKAHRPQRDPLDIPGPEIPAPQAEHSPQLPPTIELRPYQLQARDRWFANHGRGILKMATGSGKTITALSIACRLSKELDLQCLVIICPYRHLVSQWSRECQRFGMNPILAHGGKATWFSGLVNTLLRQQESTISFFVTVITTISTFTREVFQQQLSRFPKKTLLIADEVHNMGAGIYRQQLPNSIGLRLGLSATPERWFDDTGTQALTEYFGKILKPEFTLRDALNSGALCPYRYHPILVDLTSSESIKYIDLSRKIATAMQNSDLDEPNLRLNALLMKRSRLIAHAANKVSALQSLMMGRTEESHMLFYCGDGIPERQLDNAGLRHIEEVTRVLGKDLGIAVNTYTADESIEQREELRTRFQSGDLQGLVAIRCLDEGIDIPEVRTAFILASSTNPRQFIQRRGRILRQSPGKQYAEIFDFLVKPPGESANFQLERTLLRRQLIRFAEFAKLALNHGEARSEIVALQRTYGLMDV